MVIIDFKGGSVNEIVKQVFQLNMRGEDIEQKIFP
jgi:hypothetical protein